LGPATAAVAVGALANGLSGGRAVGLTCVPWRNAPVPAAAGFAAGAGGFALGNGRIPEPLPGCAVDAVAGAKGCG